VDDTAPLDGFGRRPAWITPFHDDPETDGDIDADADPEATAGDCLDTELDSCSSLDRLAPPAHDRHPT
jgi:hypothetical protein